MTNRVNLDLPSGTPFEELFCPACGAKLMSEDGVGACRHLAYVYWDELGEFEQVAPQIEGALRTALDDEDADDHPVNLVAVQLASKPILHLSVETSGMACGPVSSTLYVGIDFAPPIE